ncbi:FeoA family protein [Acinetobacter rathckeae]|uniref:FeoA family protein n=1 Tax=Acinetobacter rathckeae TaxID=2605272 RepID=UPI0018A2534C|nr:FeoA family protein [Acinetobacter rathckeae]MBF7688336.1 ferrous iron transport protein A [Acinetobacter rathckeae]MBF7695145.1 ferrous iron transport protein A [Acinetobacter rathckeae]
MRLSELKVKQAAIIQSVSCHSSDAEQSDLIASRLDTLGFVPGVQVKVIARGIFGGDPILIQVGFTRFALRKSEAEKIEVSLERGVSA